MRGAGDRGAGHVVRRRGRDSLTVAPPTHALVLTAGLGTRFRPLSDVRAKAVVPIAGRSLIARIAEWLAAFGVRDLVLNLHHKPETVTCEVGDGSRFGVRVRYSWEDPILGSAGGPRRAIPILGADTFFIVNGDTLTDLDLQAMWDRHVSTGAQVTMALIPNPRPDRYGGVIVDANGGIVRFARRGTEPKSYHFIGVQIASAAVFAELTDGEYAESVTGVYPRLISRAPGSIRAYISDAQFDDVGTPRDYLETVLRVARRERAPDRLTGRGTRIDRSAVVTDSVLWDNVTVAASCRVTRCVIADGVCLAPGSSFADKSILRGANGEPISAGL